MSNTYIMIDNRGNLLDSSSPTYSIVGNLLEEPFSDILSRYAFNKKEYEKRYDKNLLRTCNHVATIKERIYT